MSHDTLAGSSVHLIFRCSFTAALGPVTRCNLRSERPKMSIGQKLQALWNHPAGPKTSKQLLV